ncbi:MAG TPA: DUF1579 family protein [Actinospica sp.]|nr:DUF1579 family protein [Actinospica sp.]
MDMEQNTDARPPRRRRTLTAAAAIAGAAALAAAIPAAASTASAHAAPAPATATATSTAPAQIKQLDFLLGTLNCVYSDGTLLSAKVKPILGGTYVQMDIKSTNALGTEAITGKWILGWDSTDSQFISYYYDNLLNQGTSTAPGWQDGSFTLIGQYVLTGHGHLNLKDQFVPVDANHFTIYESGEIAGAWKLLDTQACTRTPGR